ncbi:MAG: hypothetical protein AAFR38_09365 [Planctomycetota bacterium]
MPHRRLFRFYQRKRVVNINANVVAAGLLSTLVVAGILAIMKRVIGTDWPSLGYTLFSAAADIVLDLAIFAALHWIANHWRPMRGASKREELELSASAPHPIHDATKIQVERAVISPLYYLLAMGGMEALQRFADWRPYTAVIVAYCAALVITRTVHTFWGLRSGTYHDNHIRAKRARIERRRRDRLERARAGTEPDAPTGL